MRGKTRKVNNMEKTLVVKMGMEYFTTEDVSTCICTSVESNVTQVICICVLGI